jgi:hypothetical protein
MFTLLLAAHLTVPGHTNGIVLIVHVGTSRHVFKLFPTPTSMAVRLSSQARQTIPLRDCGDVSFGVGSSERVNHD